MWILSEQLLALNSPLNDANKQSRAFKNYGKPKVRSRHYTIRAIFAATKMKKDKFLFPDK